MAPGPLTLCGAVSWKRGSGEETRLSTWFRVSKPGLRAQPPLTPQMGRQEMDRPQRGALFLLLQTSLHGIGHRAPGAKHSALQPRLPRRRHLLWRKGQVPTTP